MRGLPCWRVLTSFSGLQKLAGAFGCAEFRLILRQQRLSCLPRWSVSRRRLRHRLRPDRVQSLRENEVDVRKLFPKGDVGIVVDIACPSASCDVPADMR